MARKNGRFRYSLEPLLQQRRSQREASAAQERTARRVLDAHNDQARDAARTVSGVEQALRDSLKAGVSIDPRQQQALAQYLSLAREALQSKSRQATKAAELHEQTRRTLLRALQDARALERHRENREREHRRERQQLEDQKQDELTVTRRKPSWP